MNHYGHAVSRQPHIKFNPIGPVTERALESDQGVLRRDRRRAAMPDDQRLSHSERVEQ